MKIYRWTGSGSGSGTDVTSINSRIDNQAGHSTASTSDPVTIPASSTQPSFWGVFKLHCSTAPAVSVSNLKYYLTGTPDTGTTYNAAKVGVYAQCTSAVVCNTSSYGTSLTMADATTFTSGSPLSLGGSFTATGEGSSVDYVVGQWIIGTSASPGAATALTQHFRFDEV